MASTTMQLESSSSEKILVYAQAISKSQKSSSSGFGKSEFNLARASRAALALARRVLPESQIYATGHSGVLYEALARGANNGISIPLCDDPVEQAKSFPRSDYSRIIVGENSEGCFSGASLCGVLAFLRKKSLSIVSNSSASIPLGISLLLNEELIPSYIDIRRINLAFAQEFPAAASNQNKLSSIKSMEENIRAEKLPGDSSKEIAFSLSRWLRKW